MLRKKLGVKWITGFILAVLMLSNITQGQAGGSQSEKTNVLILQSIAGKLKVTTTKDSKLIARAIKDKAIYVGENKNINFDINKSYANVYAGTKGNYWGYQLDTLGIEEAWRESTGLGVKIAVVDTGVDINEISLRDRVLPGWAADGSDGRSDSNGHGTAVASIIAGKLSEGNGVIGIAPDSLIVPIAAVGVSGIVSSDVVIKGIIWAVENHVNIINISMSGVEDYPPLKAAIDYAVSNNISVIVAGGNFYQNGNPRTYPAAYNGVVAVGASNKENMIEPYSSQGDYISLVAPGNSILAPWVGNGVSSWEGTSVAAPMVAGLFALMLAKYPFLSNQQIRQALTYTAQDLGKPGYDEANGFGLPKIKGALEYISKDYFTAEVNNSKVEYGAKTISLNVKGASMERFTNPVKVNIVSWKSPNLKSSGYANNSMVSGYTVKINDDTTALEIPSYSSEFPNKLLVLTRYVKPIVSLRYGKNEKSIIIGNLCESCKIKFKDQNNKVVKSATLRGKSINYTIPNSKKVSSLTFTVTPQEGSNGLIYNSKVIKFKQ